MAKERIYIIELRHFEGYSHGYSVGKNKQEALRNYLLSKKETRFDGLGEPVRVRVIKRLEVPDYRITLEKIIS